VRYKEIQQLRELPIHSIIGTAIPPQPNHMTITTGIAAVVTVKDRGEGMVPTATRPALGKRKPGIISLIAGDSFL